MVDLFITQTNGIAVDRYFLGGEGATKSYQELPNHIEFWNHFGLFCKETVGWQKGEITHFLLRHYRVRSPNKRCKQQIQQISWNIVGESQNDELYVMTHDIPMHTPTFQACDFAAQL